MRTNGMAAALLCALLACKSNDKPQGTTAPAAGSAQSEAAPKPETTPPPKPDVVVSIKELLAAYEENELGADGRFKGKRVGVIGAVAEVKKDILDDAYVLLGSGKELEIVQAQCYFDKSEISTLATLKKGQVIALSCDGDGLLVHVQLKDCRLMRDKTGDLLKAKTE